MLMLPDQSVSLLADADEYLAIIKASDWSDVSDWESLPELLIQWVQDQAGLKIDKQPISSQEELIQAYYFLGCKEDPNQLSLMQLAIMVAIAYGTKIRRPRRSSVDDHLVLGIAPRNIVSRKCRNVKVKFSMIRLFCVLRSK